MFIITNFIKRIKGIIKILLVLYLDVVRREDESKYRYRVQTGRNVKSSSNIHYTIFFIYKNHEAQIS